MRGLTNRPRVPGGTLSVAAILFKPTRVSEYGPFLTRLTSDRLLSQSLPKDPAFKSGLIGARSWVSERPRRNLGPRCLELKAGESPRRIVIDVTCLVNSTLGRGFSKKS